MFASLHRNLWKSSTRPIGCCAAVCMLFTNLAAADQRVGLQSPASAAQRAQATPHAPTNRPGVAPSTAPSPSMTSTATDLPAACRQQAQQFHAVTTEEV